jgi:uncharacterized lipoprotein YajG
MIDIRKSLYYCMISKNGIMKKYLFLLIAVVTLVGCSPQVTSEMVTGWQVPVPCHPYFCSFWYLIIRE